MGELGPRGKLGPRQQLAQSNWDFLAIAIIINTSTAYQNPLKAVDVLTIIAIARKTRFY